MSDPLNPLARLKAEREANDVPKLRSQLAECRADLDSLLSSVNHHMREISGLENAAPALAAVAARLNRKKGGAE